MRREISLMEQWQFARLPEPVDQPPEADNMETADLPHVWNKDCPAESGCCLYEKRFTLEIRENHVYYLAFDAVGGVARVFLNGILLGEHRGSYSRFCFLADEAIRDGENVLQVLADNTRYEDVNPLMGDFSYFGGIYRDVTLLELEETHFDPAYYGSPGVELRAGIEDRKGWVRLKVHLVHGEGCLLHYRIVDADGRLAAESSFSASEEENLLYVEEPHRWNGKADPYQYRMEASLWRGDEKMDEVQLSFGFREISITSDRGFFLNGSRMKLNGVAKHQDFAGFGCGTGRKEQELDLSLIREIGANAVRLSHYQHPQHTYDLCDQAGLIVWAEIPMLAMPDGNAGIVENAKEQLKELILQNLHHPSICFWGVQNEIAMRGESEETYRNVRELDRLVKELDPCRISAGANLYSVKNDSPLNVINDAVGYNVYFGWYYGRLTDFSGFLRKFHQDNSNVALGITEYGVDCNLKFHSSKPEVKDYTEEYQCVFHEAAYEAMQADEGLWGSFIWNMFDFSSAIRDEGGVKGQNSKGLVTYDRKMKKDSFYYYKACWSKESFVHLTGKRYQNRCEEATMVKVYSNQPEVTLLVDGVFFDKKKEDPEHPHVFVFEQVPLGEKTEITAEAAPSSETSAPYCDRMTLHLVTEPDQSYEYGKKGDGNMVTNWFASEAETEGAMFPENCYSLNDRIGDLLSDSRTCELLEAEIPEIAHDERSQMYGGMSLLRILDRNAGLYSEEHLKALNQKLNQISKQSKN